MGAVYMPLGGGSINKVDAFNILSDRLLLEEKPISTLRLEVFRLVFTLGQHISYHGTKGKNDLDLWQESWDMLAGFYEGLAEIEDLVMADTHQANLQQVLELRSAEQLAEDAQELLQRRNARNA
ncbi:MAG: hypothetical protein M3Y54_22380 [Bacteroidota bacterium]|nr:hypothetical protein [Bacteroidota bacterium]